jgi:hypothetical protein
VIPVYIASSARFECAERLTAASILQNTDADVDIRIVRPEWYGMQEHGCTGFTNVRYAVPELLREHGYKRGIYLDVDMIVLGDIAELYECLPSYNLGGCLEDGSTEVMVLDYLLFCDGREHLHTLSKAELRGKYLIRPCIPLSWNVEDKVEPGMQLLHFTNLSTQPRFYEQHDKDAVKIYETYMGLAHAWTPGARWVRVGNRVTEYGYTL